MARKTKTNRYSLAHDFTCRGGNYSSSRSLYAWYQFEQDVSVAGDLLDLSGNARGLRPIGGASANRIQAPTTDAPSVDGYSCSEGFPTKSAEFDNDDLEHPDSSQFSFFDALSGDIPFSISCWAKFSSSGTTQYIATKKNGATVEWVFYLTASNEFSLFLKDQSSGGTQHRTSTSTVAVDTWHHLVATYDGTGGSNARTGITLYIDGEDVTDTSSGSTSAAYSATESTAAHFTVGNHQSGGTSTDFDGKMASLALWRTELHTDEVKALYRAQAGAVKGTKLISGISSLPPKVQLLESDIQGSYPPLNFRNGDMDAMRSRSSLPFDDTNSFTFGSSFAEAIICFEGPVVAGDFIDLTSSLGSASQRFRFTLSEETPGFPVSATDTTIPLIDTTGSPPFETRNSPAAAAKIFLDKLALFTGSLQIDAKYRPTMKEKYDKDGNILETPVIKNIIRLRHRIAGTGSFNQGNLIKVGGLAPSTLAEIPTDNISFQPFNIRITDPIRLGTLDPVDGGPSSIIAGSHTSPTLLGSGSIVKGMSDSRYFEVKNYSISPFDESRISVESDLFHETGTDRTILEGFETPAKSKTKIVIRCKSTNPLGDPIYHATGSGASGGPIGSFHSEIAGKPGSGFAYWNSDDKRWEMKDYFELASRTSGGVFSPSVPSRFGSPAGFTLLPSSSWSESETAGNKYARFRDSHNSLSADEHNKKISQLLKGVSQPTDTFGFPLASQYNATGSQEILLSDYIHHPFLLEKVKVEVKGVFGVGQSDYFSRFDPPVTKTFFLLNQKTSGDHPHVIQDYHTRVSQNTGGSSTWTNYDNLRSNRIVGNREIIGWGKIGFIRADNRLVTGSNDNFQIVNNDYDVLKIIDPPSSDPAVSSSFTLKLEPRLALKNDLLSVIPNLGSSNSGQTALTNNYGGADLLGTVSGRQIASSLGASRNSETTGSLLKFIDQPETAEKELRVKDDYYKTSPYLLLPKDRLVVGWQNIPTLETSGQLDNGATGHGTTEQVIADEIVDLIQDVKITLYGSSVREDREFNSTLNQNLSSHSVQEAIFGKPLLDQFEVEPTIVLSGSTFDALMFGDMFSTTEGIRGRRGSIAKGTAGATGSLTKNIGIFNSEQLFKDSQSVHIEHFLTDTKFFTGSGGAGSDPGDVLTVGGVPRSAIVLSNNPIGPSHKLLKEIGSLGKPEFTSKVALRPASNYLMTPAGGLATKASFLAFNTSATKTVMKIFSGSKEDALGVTSFGSAEIAKAPLGAPPKLLSSTGIKTLISALFTAAPTVTVGRDVFSWPIRTVGHSAGVVTEFRGAKYGFYNVVGTSPVTHFRRSSYGQHRDLISQPPETLFSGIENLDQTVEANTDLSTTGPVQVRFFSRNGTPDIDPLDTNCQNLDLFATSSFPYYDGESRERDVINDPPPDLTDKTSIEEAVSSIVDGEA